MQTTKKDKSITPEEIEERNLGFKFLALYPEDFAKTHDWNAVCDQLGVRRSSHKLLMRVCSVEEVEEDE